MTPQPTYAHLSLPLSLTHSIFVSRGRRLTRSQSFISRNEGSGGTSHISISSGSTHENEATGDTPDAIQAIFEVAGLAPYPLSWGENERANKTPRVSRSTFSKIFGAFGHKSEWFTCDSPLEGYKSFFLADLLAQPFAPTSIGHQGLALLFPAWTHDNEEGHIFHAFVSATKGGARRALWEYKGDYTKVPLRQKTIDWSLLPVTVRPP